MAGRDGANWIQVLQRQFVQGLTIADVYSPSDFRTWFRLLEIEHWPSVALVIRVQPSRYAHSRPESTLLVSDRLKSVLRTELWQQLVRVWPALLCNWQEELELVVLLDLPHLITKSAIVQEVLPVLEQVSLPLASRLYAGVSRNTENISFLSAAIRAARQAAGQAEQQQRPLLHVDDMEVFEVPDASSQRLGDSGAAGEGLDGGLENALETEIRQTKDVLRAYQRANRVPLETGKRQILEKLVGLMNTCRVSGVAVDGEELIDHKLFEGLVKASTASSLALWVEQSGLVFLNKLSGLAEQSTSRIVQGAISFLTAHLHEDVSLEGVALNCNVSHYYLSHLFRKETGTTVTAFIKKARIDQAMVLLRNPNLTIAEVAYKVGYQDPNYFSKSFRSYVGVSPTEFRNL